MAKPKKTLYQHLDELGYIHPDAAVAREVVDDFLNITLPPLGTLIDFDQYRLARVAAICDLRSTLHTIGLHVTERHGELVIPSKSENARIAEKYLGDSKRKRQKAMVLLANTPDRDKETADRLTMRDHLAAQDEEQLKERLQRRLGKNGGRGKPGDKEDDDGDDEEGTPA